MDNTINVRVVESNTPITVCIPVESNPPITVRIPGMQGPAGGGSADISGLISTGNADLRYYPRNTNPNGYLTAASVGGVQFINSLSGDVNLTGLGNITVSISGQTIQISGNNAGTVDLSGYVTTGSADLRYLSINSGGLYYLASNPSGYITGFNSGLYVLNANTGSYTGIFVTREESGQFYPSSNPQGYLRSGEATNVDLSGYITTGQADTRYYGINNPSGYLTGFNSGLYVLKTDTGNYTGLFVTREETGQFYPSSNPQQYTRSGDVSSTYATINNLQSTGSALNNKINSLSGYITGIHSGLQLQINSVQNGTGSFISTEQTGQFYPASNPQQYIRSGDVSGTYATIANLAATGTNLQSQINTINNTTGIFVQSGSLYTTGSINSIFQEIWIAPRTDGISGNGTSYNPYDGSTPAKLQNLLVGFNRYTGVINFLPGQYYLSGSQQVHSVWDVGNWRIKGAGIDKTIITMTGYDGISNSAGFGRYILFSAAADPLTSFAIEDITLNGGTRTSGVSTSLIYSSNPNSTARRVKVTSFGSLAPLYECFPIIFTPYYLRQDIYSKCLMEDCIAVNPWTGNTESVTAMVMTSISPDSPLSIARNANASCIIRGCCIDYGTDLPPSGQMFQGYTAPIIENSFAQGLTNGVYYDTYHLKGMVVRNNHILNCRFGVYLYLLYGSYSVDTVLVENNTIELPAEKNNYVPGDAYVGIMLNGGVSQPYVFNHVNISNNRITTTSGGAMAPGTYYGGIGVHGSDNTVIKDNILADFDLKAGYPGWMFSTGNLNSAMIWNNFSTGLRAVGDYNRPYSLAIGTPSLYVGSGNPEGIVTAVSGSIYSDYFNKIVYHKFTGIQAFGWE